MHHAEAGWHPLALSAHSWAVGIENNTGWNF